MGGEELTKCFTTVFSLEYSRWNSINNSHNLAIFHILDRVVRRFKIFLSSVLYDYLRFCNNFFKGGFWMHVFYSFWGELHFGWVSFRRENCHKCILKKVDGINRVFFDILSWNLVCRLGWAYRSLFIKMTPWQQCSSLKLTETSNTCCGQTPHPYSPIQHHRQPSSHPKTGMEPLQPCSPQCPISHNLMD